MNDEDDMTNDEPLHIPVLSFNSDGEGEIHYPDSERRAGKPDENLIPPTLNWAEIRQEDERERQRLAANRSHSPRNANIHPQADEGDLLIPPRMVW